MYAYFFFQMCLIISVTKPLGWYLHTWFLKTGLIQIVPILKPNLWKHLSNFDFIERETLVIKRLMPRRFIFFHKKKSFA